MSGFEICIHLKGDKCAESYCPYWSFTLRRCSLAVEAEKRAELLNIIVQKAVEVLEARPEVAVDMIAQLIKEMKTSIVH